MQGNPNENPSGQIWKKSPEYFTDCFNLSAVNQPLASSDNMLARISDIAGGAKMFAVMILIQREWGQTLAAHPTQLSPLLPNTNNSFPADLGWFQTKTVLMKECILYVFNILMPSSAYNTVTSLNTPISDLLGFNK